MAKTAKEKREAELSKKFMASPSKCPVCGSDDLNANDTPDGTCDMAMPMRCDDCGTTWVEHYKLVGVSDFEEDNDGEDDEQEG